MEYKNLDVLKAWLDSIMNCDYRMDAVLDEIYTQYAESGTADYEVRGYETKSGNPETYSYDVEWEEDEDGNFTYTFTF